MTPIDFQVLWWKVKVKMLVFEKCCLLNIFWLFCLKSVQIGIVDAPTRKDMFPIDFQVMWSYIHVKYPIFILIVVYSLSYDHLLDGYQTCYTMVDFREKIIPTDFWDTRSRSNCTGLHLRIVHSIFYELLAWYLPNLVQWLPLESR